MMSLILLKLCYRWWSCTNKTHISLKNINELRKLINTCLSYELANLSYTRVVFHLKHKTTHLILCHKFFLSFLSIHIHGTELIYLKITAILSNTFLFEKDWTWRFYHNSRTYKNHCNKHNYKSYNCSENIYASLNKHSLPVIYSVSKCNDRNCSYVTQLTVKILIAVKNLKLKINNYSHILKFHNHRLDTFAGLVIHINKHFVNNLVLNITHH